MVATPSAQSARSHVSLDAVIEGVLAGTIGPIDAATEGAYHAAWLERDLGSREPAVMAALGGALADRLPWVFMAGYEATLRRCFPDLRAERGWSAFANTEGVGELPGTSLTGEAGSRRLSGWKTWLAGADHVARLLVSAKHNELPLLVIRRDQQGVVIEHSRSGGYLPELVQGRVRFDDVAVLEGQVTGNAETFPTFRASEGGYVRLALNAFMLSHAVRLQAPAALVSGALAGVLAAAAAMDLALPSSTATIALGGVDARTRALAGEFGAFIATADPALHARWTRDARLYGSDALTRRAEEALAALRLALPRPSSA